MSNTLRADLQRIVKAAGKPLTMNQMYARRTRTTTHQSFIVTVCQMVTAKMLVKLPAPKGSGQGVQFVYGPGPVEANDEYERGPTKREHKGFMQLKREREAKVRGRAE